LNVDVFTYNKGSSLDDLPPGIIYMTSSSFLAVVESLGEKNISDLTFIFDEFENLLFESRESASTFINIFNRMKQCFGLSGSKFTKHHYKFFERHFKNRMINFSLTGKERIEPECLLMKVFASIKDWRSEIVRLCV
jgi:hypothetical protein